MNLEDYHSIFVICTSFLLILGIVPIASFNNSLSWKTASFSELWILGPGRTLSDYPFNVKVNESKSFFVGVRNHMDYSVYYVLYVKFRNQTQPLPDPLSSMPSPLPKIYEYDFFLRDKEDWECPLEFTVTSVSNRSDLLFIEKIRLNDSELHIDSHSYWDSEREGFYFQIFFELWYYNVTSGMLQFHDRFVSIWLNVTN
jgi:uncharacterized membrane protein